MANVTHSTLTTTNLHEPKGISTATSGQAYIANGSGSGAWTTITGLVLTGMIADFMTPIAPAGWLELDGSTAAIASYPALYAAVTIQQTGTRNATAIITGLSSTTNMKPGYYVFGTGISSGTTIVSVDSPTQITMSAAAVSSGTNTVIVSPWLIDATNITLPDVKTAGRFRRSRTATTQMGTVQADQNKQHNHTAGSNAVPSFTPSISVTDTRTWATSSAYFPQSGAGPFGLIGGTSAGIAGQAGVAVTGGSITAASNTIPSFTPTITVNNDGGTEARPISLTVMTCVKT